MHIVRSVDDLQELIDNEIPEDLHLDYKASEALSTKKKSEIAKDVSSFANSDGGQIIYGIVEDTEKHIPISLDNGADFSKFSPEWVENVLIGNIYPRIDGINIFPIKTGTGKVYYSIEIPKSYSGPHKAADRYFKRFNFQSVPMEQYEIEDVRNRQQTLKNVMTVTLVNRGMMFYFKIANVSNSLARDVEISFPPNLNWFDKKRGITERKFQFFSPETEQQFFFNVGHQLLKGDDSQKLFKVKVSYIHPILEVRREQEFFFDLSIYDGASIEKSDAEKAAEEIKKMGNGVCQKLDDLNKSIEKITDIVNPTGLRVSYSTLKNLHLLISKEEVKPEDIFLRYKNDLGILMELLEVDQKVASKIRNALFFPDKRDQFLEDVPKETRKKLSIIFKDEF